MWSPVPEPGQSYIEFEVELISRNDNGHDDNSNDEDDGHPCPSLDNLQGIGHAGGNCGSGGTFKYFCKKMVVIILFCDRYYLRDSEISSTYLIFTKPESSDATNGFMGDGHVSSLQQLVPEMFKNFKCKTTQWEFLA